MDKYLYYSEESDFDINIFFGEETAEKEWNDSLGKAYKVFFHLKSYSEFKKIKNIFLFGRRGTGKTAIIKMLDYEIKRNKVKPYSSSILIKAEDTYRDLSILMHNEILTELPYEDLVYLISKKWELIISDHALLSVYNYAKRNDISEDKNIEEIKKYLNDKNLIDANSASLIFRRILNDFREVFSNSNKLSDLGRLSAFIDNILYSEEFKSAMECMRTFLEKKKGYALVLIDSIDFYQMDDIISNASVNALINLSVKYYQKLKIGRITTKIAFPSELYPKIEQTNKEKVKPHLLFILWRYKDLLCMMAKRHYDYFNPKKSIKELDEFEDFDVSRGYLYSYLPETIASKHDLEFDTFASIIRHTHKKPRQIIQLFNSIYSVSQFYDIDISKIIPSDKINVGIHWDLDTFVEGAIEIYREIYPDINDIVERILQNMDQSFDYGKLNSKIAQISDIRSKNNLRVGDVIKRILETGLMGEEIKKREIGNEIGNEITLKESVFEYQIKRGIRITNDSIFVIHPMAIHYFGININLSEFIYPIPLEEEEKNCYDKLYEQYCL